MLIPTGFAWIAQVLTPTGFAGIAQVLTPTDFAGNAQVLTPTDFAGNAFAPEKTQRYVRPLEIRGLSTGVFYAPGRSLPE